MRYFFSSLRMSFGAACLVALGLDQNIEDLALASTARHR